MDSSLFSLLNRLRSHRLPETLTRNAVTSRCYTSGRSSRISFIKEISPIGNPNINVVQELDKWVDQGKPARVSEVQRVVRELRKRRRFAHALEVAEWMSTRGLGVLNSSHHAVQLDLVGRVRGLDYAESYFNNLHENNKTEKTYGALLSCYVREQLIEKSLSHMLKMKELGFARRALSYNDVMCLLTNTGQHEKVPDVLAEMKEDGVLPDNFSYRICINSYGVRSDIVQVEKLLEEMECQPHITVDWNTYAVIANIYIKAGLAEKAVAALKKSEEKLGINNGTGYNHLISLYGSLGNKTEILRLWGLLKSSFNRLINRDYTTMLGSLVKIGELEEAKTVLKEWISSGSSYDGRVPNVLLMGYCQNGLMEKAEEMIENMVKIGKIPLPNSYGIVAGGYVNKGDMKKAVEFMKTALSLHAGYEGWKPNPEVIKSILGWFGDEGDVEGTEAFVDLLKAIVPMNRNMYHALIKANIRKGKDVNGLVERMKADKINENEETKKILSLNKITE